VRELGGHSGDSGVASELYQIHVDPGHFRQGIGGCLHEATVGVWQAAEVTAARLRVCDFNDRARAFYARHGWSADDHEDLDGTRIGEHRQLGYRLRVPAQAARGILGPNDS
jgi:GNAT superfamily N-acetyltransferase